jgi:hypothetical protein
MEQIQEHQFKVQNTCEDDRMQNDIVVEVYDNFEDLLDMQPSWDSFMEEMNAEIFLTYDWCRLWWKYYGKKRDLKVFVFKQNDNISGILPLFFETIGLWPAYISIIKIVGTDFIPVTINIPLKKELLNDIIRLLTDKLNQFYNWDLLHFGAICGKCEIIDQIEKAFVEALSLSCTVLRKSSDVQTYFKIADSLEKQIASFSKVQRKRLRHFYNDKKDGESIDSQFTTEAQFDTFFNAFVQMHQAKWQKSGQAGHFEDWPDARNFHYEVASTQLKYNRLRLLRMIINDREAGYQYSYKFGDTYYAFLNARTEEEQFKHVSYYNLLICEDARHAITENVKHLDSMRGKYDNKLQAGGYLLPVRNLYIYPKRITKLIRIYPMQFFFSLLDIIYLKIFRRRLLPKLSIRPGSFNKLWIKTHMLSLYNGN